MPTVDEALAAARTALDDLEAAIGVSVPAAAPVPVDPTVASAADAVAAPAPVTDSSGSENDSSSVEQPDTVTVPASELAPDLPKGVQQ